MAGIGFELKKLFNRQGLFASFRAYGYAGVVCTGPMLLGIVLLLGVMYLCDKTGGSRHSRELLEGKEEDVYGKAGYYVAPMYRDGLALAMEKMCESRRRRLRMGKNGQERVKAYYRQERMIRLYRELYEEVIQKNGWNRI